jgi:hypothetical protein
MCRVRRMARSDIGMSRAWKVHRCWQVRLEWASKAQARRAMFRPFGNCAARPYSAAPAMLRKACRSAEQQCLASNYCCCSSTKQHARVARPRCLASSCCSCCCFLPFFCRLASGAAGVRRCSPLTMELLFSASGLAFCLSCRCSGASL